MKEWKLKIIRTINQDELDGIIDSAINYCSYWCIHLAIKKPATEPCSAMSEIVTRGGMLTFVVDEPFQTDGHTRFILTADKMIRGLEKYGVSDWEDFDGPMADAALQMALFGEVIYG
jgi:hypothetical protein